MTLAAQIRDSSAVLVDTAPIVYFLEEHPLGEQFESLFADIDSERIEAFVTQITVAEVLVGPSRRATRCSPNAIGPSSRRDLVGHFKCWTPTSPYWRRGCARSTD